MRGRTFRFSTPSEMLWWKTLMMMMMKLRSNGRTVETMTIIAGKMLNLVKEM